MGGREEGALWFEDGLAQANRSRSSRKKGGELVFPLKVPHQVSYLPLLEASLPSLFKD